MKLYRLTLLLITLAIRPIFDSGRSQVRFHGQALYASLLRDGGQSLLCVIVRSAGA